MMRIQDVRKLLVGLVFLAALPMGSAQISRECDTDDVCDAGRCCTADGRCSRRDMGSVISGEKTSDVCECASKLYDAPTGRCGCEDDSDCDKDKCCYPDGTCSRRDKGSVIAGMKVIDVCECASQLYDEDTGRCGCADDSDCDTARCCHPDGTCSKRDKGSVTAGEKAADICECASQLFDVDTGRCGCEDDDDCDKAKCCTNDGTCSRKDAESVKPGKNANDQCECLSLEYSDDEGICMCSDSEKHCVDNQCCRADHHCSNKPGASVFGNRSATDACECVSGEIDNDTGKCLCSEDSHCGDGCCLDDNTCSKRAKGSVAAGKRPNNACECASNIIVTSTGKCGCKEAGDCSGKPEQVCIKNECHREGKVKEKENTLDGPMGKH